MAGAIMMAACDQKWAAVPGTGANGLDKKFCDGTIDADGCPYQPYNDAPTSLPTGDDGTMRRVPERPGHRVNAP